LVNAYPDSVQTASKDGMLPFHYACLNQVLSFEDLMIFLSLHPEAVAFLRKHFMEAKKLSSKIVLSIILSL
jgi:hypothetical protein